MKVAIIGAGAAGYFAAIAIAVKRPEAEITLYEATGKTLSKLIISGGGRCNVTTSTTGAKELSSFYPRGGKELVGPFSRFDSSDTVNWFTSRGVKLVTEDDGRMFPSTHRSLTVANCLREEAQRLGVTLCLHHQLKKISKHDNSDTFELTFKKTKERQSADFVLLTTGGARGGHELATMLGHKIIDPVPSLFSFEIHHNLLKELQGVSFQDASLTLSCGDEALFREKGPVLVTHWGLSGPAIIRLSSLAARALALNDYQAVLSVNFISSLNTDQAREKLMSYKQQHVKRKVSLHSPFDLPQSFWEQIVKSVDTAIFDMTYADLSKKHIQSLAEMLTAATFQVTGKGRFKDEFVTCGGVSLGEINFKTMESRICKGLFFAGEILDIDGLTGGYNFQCAWTTGWIAGESVAQ